MAYTKQNFEDGQVLTAEHLNKMEQGIEDASVQSDWNQTDETAADFIKNKPFETVEGYGDTLTWTAITEADFDESKIVESFYPVSDARVTLDDLSQGGRVSVPAFGIDTTFTADECSEIESGFIVIAGMFLAVLEDNLTLIDGDTTIVFPKAGVYAIVDVLSADFSLTINGYDGLLSVTVKPLEEKYIPDNIVREADLVQPDWEQTDETALDYIKNKPEIPTHVAYKHLYTFTDSDGIGRLKEKWQDTEAMSAIRLAEIYNANTAVITVYVDGAACVPAVIYIGSVTCVQVPQVIATNGGNNYILKSYYTAEYTPT